VVLFRRRRGDGESRRETIPPHSLCEGGGGEWRRADYWGCCCDDYARESERAGNCG
jgi:hypothetical protein